jgi:hypothetical protein
MRLSENTEDIIRSARALKNGRLELRMLGISGFPSYEILAKADEGYVGETPYSSRASMTWIEKKPFFYVIKQFFDGTKFTRGESTLGFALTRSRAIKFAHRSAFKLANKLANYMGIPMHNFVPGETQ